LDGNSNNRLHGADRKINKEVKKMPRPHEHGYERPPHEEILERLHKIEETIRRIEDKIR